MVQKYTGRKSVKHLWDGKMFQIYRGTTNLIKTEILIFAYINVRCLCVLQIIYMPLHFDWKMQSLALHGNILGLQDISQMCARLQNAVHIWFFV